MCFIQHQCYASGLIFEIDFLPNDIDSHVATHLERSLHFDFLTCVKFGTIEKCLELSLPTLIFFEVS